MDLTGLTLGGFQIESLLGRGSMAEVYQARQLGLDRFVALKVVEEGQFTPGEQIKRFLREGKALGRLEHPNIVPVYAQGEQAPYYFFAMRLVRGGTLEGAIRGGVSRSQALAWTLSICRALAHAHGMDILHRDLKPTNVLIHDGVALLSDFGMARLRDLSTLTQRGQLLGTPLYMAPEQTVGDPASKATDVFALGVMMYQMLAGWHPFAREEGPAVNTAERRTRLFRRIQNTEFEPLEQAIPGLDPSLAAILKSALAREPSRRFSDGREMLAALEPLLNPGPPPDHPLVTSGRSQVADRDDGDEGSGTGTLAAVVAPEGPAPLEPRPPSAESRPTVRPLPRASLGRYRLLREIGHGGQGVVYEAHDPVLDRVVALKVLQDRPWGQDDAALAELFRHEARVAAKLSHPHIITIHDFGIEGASEFLTMQLIDGPSLERLIHEVGPLPPGVALDIVAQAADALGHAHQAGVIHLDVKPGNILLQQTRRLGQTLRSRASSLPFGLTHPHAVLTDFTISRIRHANARRSDTPQASATVPYASPEQLQQPIETLLPVSDLFSLGVVFHEMLTGKRLFDAPAPEITHELVLYAAIPPPSVLAPAVSPALDRLCLRMLERDPRKRIPSAAEVVAAAEEALSAEGSR